MKQKVGFEEVEFKELVYLRGNTGNFDLIKLEQKDACYIDDEILNMYYATIRRDHIGLWFPVTWEGLSEWKPYRKTVKIGLN